MTSSSSHPSSSSAQQSGPPQLPHFLQLSRSGRAYTEILQKASDLQWSEHIRLAQAQQAQRVSNRHSGRSSGRNTPITNSGSPRSSTPDSPGPNASNDWSRLSTDATLSRNRYGNIDPFNYNRIKLRVGEGEEDYINASPILLRSSEGRQMKWIATQGPKHPTTSHLYRMLFDETGGDNGQPATVVMLTQTHEGGREKCFRYYPLSMDEPKIEVNEQDGGAYGDGWRASVDLESLEFDERLKSERRVMRLTVWDKLDGKEKEREREKTTHHYLYSGWPDFGVPETSDRRALVELVRATRPPGLHAGDNEEDSPRIVHCSAGVGRSGTFIALDYLLAELEDGALDRAPDLQKGQDWDPICSTVETMRQQRMMMVQGESQFLFLYEIIRELWLERHGQSGQGLWRGAR